MTHGRDASKNPYKCFEMDYDEKNDIMDICVNRRWKEHKGTLEKDFVYGDESPNGVVTFFYEDTGEVEGYKIFDFKKKLKEGNFLEEVSE